MGRFRAGVVDDAADAGLGLRNDPHDRLGRGCADEAHAAAAEQRVRGRVAVATLRSTVDYFAISLLT
jgi:hypothetical protein